jgi:hypothetical protein
MQIDLFNAFRNNADCNGVLFYYNGMLSQNIIATMGDAFRQRLESQAASGPITRKLFSSYVEIVQNALHYSPPSTPLHGDKIVAVAMGKIADKYYIVCGNLIQKQHIERIREKIEPLCNMSSDEIKKAYRQQLRSDQNAEDNISKGAGLGFLTVARDASEPIEYSIVVDDINSEKNLAYFYLKVTI